MTSGKSVNWTSIDEAENIPNNIAEELFPSGIIPAHHVNLASSISFPRYAGHWQHGNTSLAMMKKPRWLTRVMMRLVFETTWKDNPSNNILPRFTNIQF
jgi:hypothetical protein